MDSRLTRDEFKALLIRLNPANKWAIENNGGNLPMLTNLTAAHCFIYELEKQTYSIQTDVIELRRQCMSLVKYGYFDFKGE